MPSPHPPQLDVTTLLCEVEALSPFTLPDHTGPMLRGLLKGATRDANCITDHASCQGCPVLPRCGYGAVWEAPPAPGARARGVQDPIGALLPQPLAQPQTPITPSTRLTLTFHMLGDTPRFTPETVAGLHEALRTGTLGSEHARATLRAVHLQGNSAPVTAWTHDAGWAPTLQPPQPRRVAVPLGDAGARLETRTPAPVHVDLITPLHMRNAARHARTHIDAEALLRHLVHRLEVLCAQFGHTPATLRPWRDALHHAAQRARLIRDTTHMVAFHRWSNRQRKRVPMRGLVGEVVFEPLPTALVDLLRAGAELHAGKYTHFGFGKLRVHSDSPD